MPPVYAVPVLIPAFVGLYWMIEEARPRAAFLAGWWFGFGHFTAGLYWVANALLTEPARFGWLAPVAPVGLGLLLAGFPALATLAARSAGARGVGGVLLLAAAWAGTEWLRGWVLTGFPWNLMGSVWAFSDAMLQSTAVIGTHGLGLLTIIAVTMPAVLVSAPVPWRSVVAAWLVLLAVAGAGAARLELAGDVGSVPGVTLRLVQPSIPQPLKWRPDLRDRHLAFQAMLSATGAGADSQAPPTHVIWAETAAPMFIADDPDRLRWIANATPPGGLTILGAPRRAPADQPMQLWNSMLVVNAEGSVIATYDKSHLVPFGEYMPLRGLLPFDKLTAGTTDFSPGPGLTTLHLPGLPPAGPLICYEIIFPGRVAQEEDRPAWLLNLTNDAWYGHSAGPYQHLVAARLRAVEEGLAVVRVANNGISAIIDPFGRTVASLPLGARGVVDGSLPVALSPTLYGRFGEPLVIVGLILVAGVGRMVERRRVIG